MTAALEAEALGFRYPGGHGFWDISFQASAGEILCIFGRNGSGKTTLLRVLSTLIAPQAGRFFAGGFDGSRDREAVRREIFPVYDASAHFDHLTGEENIDLFLLLYGVRSPESPASLSELFTLDLARKVGEYSLGMKRKLSLVESFLCSRPVTFFDEPTLGLDSSARAQFFARARKEAAGGSCIVICTNRIEDTAFADRLFRLENGSLDPVTSRDELLEGLTRVSFSYPDQEITEYIPSTADLPVLVQRMLMRGTLTRIEIAESPASTRDSSLWDDEARQKVSRAPRALQNMITTIVERHAREAGYSRITPEVVDEVRRRFERR